MSASASRAHEHHGRLHIITGPCLKFYHATATPFYRWLGHQLGGRAYAGQMGHRARLFRLLGNAISLAAILAEVLWHGASHFWDHGAHMTTYPLLGLIIGISINTFAWLADAACKHLKIEQYYDAEMELHDENESFQQKQYPLFRKKEKLVMNGTRTLHDINSVGGSALGLFGSGLPLMLDWLSLATYAFNPYAACIIFLTSRISALVSVIALWGTNQHRLRVYRQVIKDEMQSYYDYQEKTNLKHGTILNIIEQVFKALNIQDSHQYTSWVKFRCYKALEETLIQKDTVQHLQNALQMFTQPSGKKTIFSRDKLMKIDGTHVSVLDSMPLLEAHLFKQLNPQLPEPELHLEPNKQPLSSLLTYHYNRSLQAYPSAKARPPALGHIHWEDPDYQIHTAHGSKFVPYSGTRKIVEKAFHDCAIARATL